MRKFGLIGYPLGHSFSESYFKEKFEKEGIDDAVYTNYPLENIEEFKPMCEADPSIRGLNVTIPYKETVIKYLDALSDAARETRAVNTICYCKKSSHRALVGHNTDVTGFRKSLNQHILVPPEQALILGTGGSSKAVEYVLDEININIIRVSSSKKEGTIAYEDLTKTLIEETALIVNTTPLGMYPKIDACPDIPYEYLSDKHLLFDLVYNPEETLFLKKGRERNARTVNGLNMLKYQAEASWEIWNRK